METNGEGEAAQRILRLSDIEISWRMLMPIRGYNEMSLVSLEEAVQPLISILPKVKDYVDVAKQRCANEPADGLTQDESASIMLYSMEWKPHNECLYFILNETLRNEDRRKLMPWFLYLKLFLTALSRIPSQHRTVCRGVKSDLTACYRVGKTFVWWGFSSCSESVDKLQAELSLNETDTRTIFMVECDSGKDISRHIMLQSKEEILLLPGFYFEVAGSFNASNGLHIIQLKEIRAHFPMIPMLMLHPSSGRDNFDRVTVPRVSQSTQKPEDKNISDTIEQQTKEAISNTITQTANETIKKTQ